MLKQLLRVTLALFAILCVYGTLSAQDCTIPLEFIPALENESVQCLDQLPTACDEDQGASRGTVSCGIAEDIQSRSI